MRTQPTAEFNGLCSRAGVVRGQASQNESAADTPGSGVEASSVGGHHVRSTTKTIFEMTGVNVYPF